MKFYSTLFEFVGGTLVIAFMIVLVCLIFRVMCYLPTLQDPCLAPAPQATVQERLDQMDAKLDLLLQERNSEED